VRVKVRCSTSSRFRGKVGQNKVCLVRAHTTLAPDKHALYPLSRIQVDLSASHVHRAVRAPRIRLSVQTHNFISGHVLGIIHISEN
jgi:hypothetical protein